MARRRKKKQRLDPQWAKLINNSSDDDSLASCESRNSLVEEDDDVAMPGVQFASEGGKYWAQRYRLFSRFAEGVWMTRRMFYSVTMEDIARDVAERHARLTGSQKGALHIALDVFCGAGGNMIQLALARKSVVGDDPARCDEASQDPQYPFAFDLVVGIDKSEACIVAARRNCDVYCVPASRVEFVAVDITEPNAIFSAIQRVCESRLGMTYRDSRSDTAEGVRVAVHMSPPWGGEEYRTLAAFDVERHLVPMPLSRLLRSVVLEQLGWGNRWPVATITSVSVFLPRNMVLHDVARSWAWAVLAQGKSDGCVALEVVRHVVDHRLKAVTVFFGQ